MLRTRSARYDRVQRYVDRAASPAGPFGRRRRAWRRSAPDKGLDSLDRAETAPVRISGWSAPRMASRRTRRSRTGQRVDALQSGAPGSRARRSRFVAGAGREHRAQHGAATSAASRADRALRPAVPPGGIGRPPCVAVARCRTPAAPGCRGSTSTASPSARCTIATDQRAPVSAPAPPRARALRSGGGQRPLLGRSSSPSSRRPSCASAVAAAAPRRHPGLT